MKIARSASRSHTKSSRASFVLAPSAPTFWTYGDKQDGGSRLPPLVHGTRLIVCRFAYHRLVGRRHVVGRHRPLGLPQPASRARAVGVHVLVYPDLPVGCHRLVVLHRPLVRPAVRQSSVWPVRSACFVFACCLSF